MEDQNQEAGQSQPEESVAALPPGRRVSPLLAVLLLIIIGLGVWAVTSRRQAFDAAAYLPQDVAIAMTMDVSRTPDKVASREFILGVLKDAGLKDPEKDLLSSLGKELKMDLARDVVPRLNGKGGFAVGTEMMGSIPGVTMVLGAKSHADAVKLVDVVKAKLEKEKQKFATANYKGQEYIKVKMQMAHVCVGAVDNGLVATLGDDTFESAVERRKDKSSLAHSEHYTKYTVPGDSTVATVFYSGPGFYKLISPIIGMMTAQMGVEAAEQMKKAYESVIACAASIQADGSGLSTVVKALGTREAAGADPRPLEQLVSDIPANAAFAFYGGDIDKMWSQTKKQIDSMPGEMAALSMWTGRIKEMVGIDVFEDVLDHLKSMTLYYVPRVAPGPDGFPGDIVISLQVDKPESVRRALAKVNSALSRFGGQPMKQASIAGQQVSLGLFGKGQPVGFADAVVGDTVLMAIAGGGAADAGKATVAASKPTAKSLETSPRFQAARRQLPAKSGVIMYGDVGAGVRALQTMITNAGDRRVALDVVKKVGPFAMVASTKGKESEAKLVVPFLK